MHNKAKALPAQKLDLVIDQIFQLVLRKINLLFDHYNSLRADLVVIFHGLDIEHLTWSALPGVDDVALCVHVLLLLSSFEAFQIKKAAVARCGSAHADARLEVILPHLVGPNLILLGEACLKSVH